MKIGIVAEGPADVAVLRNILKGKLGLERKDVLAIRPELAEDETDLGAPGRSGGYRERSAREQSNWLLVLKECEERVNIEAFLDNPLDEERLVVVHIDTAEAHLQGYDVRRPPDRKAATYCDELRRGVVGKINELLGPELAERVRHAVAVEETDAWVLTIYEERKRDTASFFNAKKQLELVLARGGSGRGATGRDRPRRDAAGKGGSTRESSAYQRYHELTVSFRDGASLDTCAGRNRSLRVFVDSL